MKLQIQQLGPFHIRKDVGDHAYQLALPSELHIFLIVHLADLNQYDGEAYPSDYVGNSLSINDAGAIIRR